MVPEILDWAVYGSYPSRKPHDSGSLWILGDLIELPGEAGWDITLYRMIKDEIHPTSVSFACGD